MTKRPFPVALQVSVALTTTVLVLALAFASIQYQMLKRQAFENGTSDLRTLALVAQGRLESALAQNDIVDAERNLMNLKLNENVQLGAVVNEQGEVLYSSNQLLTGRQLANQLPYFEQSQVDQVRRSYRPVLAVNEDRTYLYAYYPLSLDSDSNQLRPGRLGVLFIHWSLNRQYQKILYQIQKEMFLVLTMTMCLVLFLMFLLHRLLLNPIRQLAQKASGAVNEKGENFFDVKGADEIQHLSAVIGQMNQQLAASAHEARRSEMRWLFALEAAGDGVLDYDYRTGACFFSQQLRRLLNLAEDISASLEAWQQNIHPEDWLYVERCLQRHLRGLADICNVEYRSLSSSGSVRHMQMRAKVVERRTDGEPGRLIATFSDITLRHQTETALRASEEKYRALFDLAQEGIWVIDEEGRTTLVNNSMAQMLGYGKEEMLGRPLVDFMGSDHARIEAEQSIRRRMAGVTEQFDFQMVSRSGRTVYVTIQTAPILDENGIYRGAIAGIMDITERRAAEERIRQQAYFDDLTLLPNRRLLHEKLTQEYARATRHQHLGALLFFDLDHFKNINDSLGHQVGDELLVAVAQCLRKCVREEDTLARLGGDEFVLLLPELGPMAEAAATQAHWVAQKIQAALTNPFNLSEHKLAIGCSIGIALFPQEQEGIYDILKQADSAMYRAKALGRNAICFFSKEMHAQLEQNLQLQIRLPTALEQNQLELYYQAQFNQRHKLIGAEVLLRWKDPERGFIRPDMFIRAAEESGFIITLGDWALKQACWQLKQWLPHLPASFERLAVNISARQFALDDFPAQVKAIVDAAGVEPRFVELEITESLLLNQLEQVVKNIRILHEMGFGIALDDFGTGYSSLSYLRSLPLHKLKIDQAFVRDINSDKNDRAIVETIIAMARLMELDVIAEGVEDQKQLQFLQEKDCKQFQGYYFARPVPAAEFFNAWLQNGTPTD